MSALEELLSGVSILAKSVEKAYGYRDDKLSAGERKVLQLLDRLGPQTVPDIARIRSTSRQNIQVLINRLAAENCVELTENPAHKRSALVGVTNRGKVVSASCKAQETMFSQRLESEVSKAEVVAAAALLSKLGQLLARDRKPPKEKAKQSAIRARKRKARPVVPRVNHSKVLAEINQPGASPAPDEETQFGENELPFNLL
jgi:DNA-binding MarR family transcriptional regulator